MPQRGLRVAEVVKTLMLGPLPIGSGDDFAFRVEILRDVAYSNRFFVKVWRIEHYRIVPSFPAVRSRRRAHADEAILVEDLFLGEGITGKSIAQVESKLLKRAAELLGG